MGLSHSPKIVTDGLLMCLDAENSKSYTGTNNWFNLVSSSHTGNIVNKSFSSITPKYFNLDGITQYIDCGPDLDLTNKFTLAVWFWPDSTWDIYAVIIDKYDGSATSYRLQRFFDTNQLEFYDGSNIVIGGEITVNSWNYLVATGNNGNCKLYINGEQVGDGTIFNPLETATSNTFIGRLSGLEYSWAKGLLATCQIYDRALNDEEVEQNFNALRGRFGI